MSFDSIPEDAEQSYPCPNCDGGNLKANGYRWECDNCEFECGEGEDDNHDE